MLEGPDSPFRWSEIHGSLFLHLRAGCIASIKPAAGGKGVDVVLRSWIDRKEVCAWEPNFRMAKRNVERWFFYQAHRIDNNFRRHLQRGGQEGVRIIRYEDP